MCVCCCCCCLCCARRQPKKKKRLEGGWGGGRSASPPVHSLLELCGASPCEEPSAFVAGTNIPLAVLLVLELSVLVFSLLLVVSCLFVVC